MRKETPSIGEAQERIGIPKEILLINGDTKVLVLTEGAMITKFTVSSTDILYPDQVIETVKGPKRRGGIPLLYPQAGPITEDGEEFRLSQHGFARDQEWEVTELGENNDTVTLRLISNEETRKMFPYDFELNYKITALETGLRAELVVLNKSDKKMPVAPGFHPYFNIPVEDKPEITTNIVGFEPDKYDWNSSQMYGMPHPTIFKYPGNEIEIQSSPELKTMMIWSEQKGDYVCFEPWTGRVNVLQDPDKRLEVKPNESQTVFI